MIENRLSSLSSSEQAFLEAAPAYQAALDNSGYKHTLKYKNNETTTRRNRTRKRQIVRYNPPYNSAVTTNIGKQFLALIDKHFPHNKQREDKLNKIINRNCLTISYRTSPNIGTIISGHNKKS